jgi:hypothetical protein
MASVSPLELTEAQCQVLTEIREAIRTGEYDREFQANFAPKTGQGIVLLKTDSSDSKTIPCTEQDYLALVKLRYICSVSSSRDSYRGHFHDRP